MIDYQVCKRCVMDTTNSDIIFDEEGVCSYCHHFEMVTKKNWFPNEEGDRKLNLIIDKIKQVGAGNPYDCIIGLSGGLDSSYLALKAKNWGLRPLVIHVDAGWNSELAVANIEKVVNYCDYHLYTHVVNWDEMRDLQLAYLSSGIANQDVPQDHVFFSSIYHYAVKHNIRYILSGGNTASEGVFPKNWLWSAMDASNLKAIYRKHGHSCLKTYNTISFFKYYLWYPLNFMDYNIIKAQSELEETVGWSSYGAKHNESVFTRFYQKYYLPEKFGYDMRRPHLSSLILSGQMSRVDAVNRLDEVLYDPVVLENDMTYLCKKLRISREKFMQLMAVPNQEYFAFKNWGNKVVLLKKIQVFIEQLLKRRVNVYS